MRPHKLGPPELGRYAVLFASAKKMIHGGSSWWGGKIMKKFSTASRGSYRAWIMIDGPSPFCCPFAVCLDQGTAPGVNSYRSLLLMSSFIFKERVSFLLMPATDKLIVCLAAAAAGNIVCSSMIRVPIVFLHTRVLPLHWFRGGAQRLCESGAAAYIYRSAFNVGSLNELIGNPHTQARHFMALCIIALSFAGVAAHTCYKCRNRALIKCRAALISLTIAANPMSTPVGLFAYQSRTVDQKKKHFSCTATYNC